MTADPGLPGLVLTVLIQAENNQFRQLYLFLLVVCLGYFKLEPKVVLLMLWKVGNPAMYRDSPVLQVCWDRLAQQICGEMDGPHHTKQQKRNWDQPLPFYRERDRGQEKQE